MVRILLIDEDAVLRSSLRRLLVLEGHTVTEAGCGADGVAAALADPPDVVLCDLVMPGMDGYEVMRRLRADARTAGVPFVVVTGSATPADVERGLRLGADGYVIKPFEIDTLLAVVDRARRRGPAQEPLPD